MLLTLHATLSGSCWALDGRQLPGGFSLSQALARRRADLRPFLETAALGPAAAGRQLAPVEADSEIWACGVTYQRSREARRAESDLGDVYDRVYAAERPELFFKALGWRTAGPADAIRVRADSVWNVPEPEMVLVLNAYGEIVGFTAGNDVSSRSIEGENPLYLPQAKIYTGACALGPSLSLLPDDDLRRLPIQLDIWRGGQPVFHGETSTARLQRPLEQLAAYLFRELSFPRGVFLLTGTGIVPPDEFSLAPGDRVRVTVGGLSLENAVQN